LVGCCDDRVDDLVRVFTGDRGGHAPRRLGVLRLGQDPLDSVTQRRRVSVDG
jgi:hypothetical protein